MFLATLSVAVYPQKKEFDIQKFFPSKVDFFLSEMLWYTVKQTGRLKVGFLVKISKEISSVLVTHRRNSQQFLPSWNEVCLFLKPLKMDLTDFFSV